MLLLCVHVWYVVCTVQWHISGTCCVVVLLWEAQLALTRWKPPARGREELWREEREKGRKGENGGFVRRKVGGEKEEWQENFFSCGKV